MICAALLEHALVREGTSELYAQAFKGLLKSSKTDQAWFATVYAEKIDWLQGFLSSVNEEGEFVWSLAMVIVFLSSLELPMLDTQKQVSESTHQTQTRSPRCGL